MKLSQTQLRNLSQQIESGRAVTAMATANLLLKRNCPLRVALAKKALSQLTTLSVNTKKIIAGEIINREAISHAILENTPGTKNYYKKAVIPSDYSTQLRRCNQTRRITLRRAQRLINNTELPSKLE